MKAECKYFIFQIFIFGFLFIFINCECERSTPFNYNGQCRAEACTDEESEEGSCFIDNPIIKTQFINGIMDYDTHPESKFDLIKYSNGDIVLVISYSDSDKSVRQFGGLKNDGDYLFMTFDEDFNPSYLTIEDSENDLCDFKLFFSKDETNQEYLVSSCNESPYYFEIYNTNDKTIVKYNYDNIFEYNNGASVKHKGYPTIIEIKQNNIYYSIFGTLFSEDDSTYYFILYKHFFFCFI